MLVVSGHEYHLKRKNKTAKNWKYSKNQTHKCRATAITDGENLIETRGQHNHDISTGKPDARLVLKNIKDVSNINTPTVAVATAIQPITEDIATQLALPTKKKTYFAPHNERASNEKKSYQSLQQPEVLTVGKMITRGLFYSATLKWYVCLKHQIFGWLMELSKSPRKCFINFTPYMLVFQE